MGKFVAAIILLVACTSSLGAAPKVWDEMNAQERMAWARQQTPRICPHGIVRPTDEEYAQFLSLIPLATPTMVEDEIKDMCIRPSVSK